MYALKQADREHEHQLFSINFFCIKVSDSELWDRYGETIYRPIITEKMCQSKARTLVETRLMKYASFVLRIIVGALNMSLSILLFTEWFQYRGKYYFHEFKLKILSKDSVYFTSSYHGLSCSSLRKKDFGLYGTVFIMQVVALMDFRKWKADTIYFSNQIWFFFCMDDVRDYGKLMVPIRTERVASVPNTFWKFF